MKIIPNKENTESLIKLWSDVFGDEREYIELLFPYGKSVCDIFAEFDGGEIVSALYLLDCSLSFGGVEYNGKYLYAAATDEKYRGKGFMASLINEAKGYCKSAGLDYISLVPANEGLYNYYEKFGFVSAMHRTTVSGASEISLAAETEISGEEYFAERRKRLDNSLNFTGNSVGYAISCLEYSGMKFYRNSVGQLFMTEGESVFFDELIDGKNAMRFLVNNEIDEKSISTDRFGMLYPINAELIRDWNSDDLYMNIALD